MATSRFGDGIFIEDTNNRRQLSEVNYMLAINNNYSYTFDN